MTYKVTRPYFATESLINNQFAEFCKNNPTYASVALDWKFVILKYLGEKHKFRICFNIYDDDDDRRKVWEKSVDEIIFSLIKFNKDEEDKAVDYNEFASRYKLLLDQNNYIFTEKEKELILIKAYLMIQENEEEKVHYNILKVTHDLSEELRIKKRLKR